MTAMGRYVLKRLGLILPTLFLILLTNFSLIQLAPGGPVEQKQAQIEATMQANPLEMRPYQGAVGLSDEARSALRVQYGFDKPAHKRFWLMIKNYARFELGQSFFKAQSVSDLILEKLPVTVSLGFWSFLTVYGVALPLGVLKAVRHGTVFDRLSSLVLAVGVAVPTVLVSVFLLVFFAGGRYWQIFPMQGMVSEAFFTLGFFGKIKDYFWHLVLPLFASSLGGVASVVMLTKASVLDELEKNYVKYAYAKGLGTKRVLFSHVLKNAALPIMATLPNALVAVFFVGNFLVEIIFNLDGLGRLAFEAVVQRDYPVVFGILYVYSLASLLVQVCADVGYHLLNPRLDFEWR